MKTKKQIHRRPVQFGQVCVSVSARAKTEGLRVIVNIPCCREGAVRPSYMEKIKHSPCNKQEMQAQAWPAENTNNRILNLTPGACTHSPSPHTLINRFVDNKLKTLFMESLESRQGWD